MTAVTAISPNGSYVVVWEWENRPNRWRPYSPEVTQLLERAHNKKINRIYLKDADPLLSDYYINMTSFEQLCETTGTKYSVRREFYPQTSPAGKVQYPFCLSQMMTLNVLSSGSKVGVVRRNEG